MLEHAITRLDVHAREHGEILVLRENTPRSAPLLTAIQVVLVEIFEEVGRAISEKLTQFLLGHHVLSLVIRPRHFNNEIHGVLSDFGVVTALGRRHLVLAVRALAEDGLADIAESVPETEHFRLLLRVPSERVHPRIEQAGGVIGREDERGGLSTAFTEHVEQRRDVLLALALDDQPSKAVTFKIALGYCILLFKYYCTL